MSDHEMSSTFQDEENTLESPWTVWLDKKVRQVTRQESDKYAGTLKKLGGFKTVEGFYRLFSHMRRASELPNGVNVSLFRDGCKPMWEQFPQGGCWLVRVKRFPSSKDRLGMNPDDPNVVDLMWEGVVLALIGEAFGSPDVVGAVVGVRARDVVFSVWNQRSNLRFAVGEKLKELLCLTEHQVSVLSYKEHCASLRDHSTSKNATNYVLSNQLDADPTPVVPMTIEEEAAEEDDVDAMSVDGSDDGNPVAAVAA